METKPCPAAVEAEEETGGVSPQAPFQGRVPDGKLFTPAYSVQRLLDVLNGLDAADSGGFFAWDGQPIEF